MSDVERWWRVEKTYEYGGELYRVALQAFAATPRDAISRESLASGLPPDVRSVAIEVSEECDHP